MVSVVVLKHTLVVDHLRHGVAAFAQVRVGQARVVYVMADAAYYQRKFVQRSESLVEPTIFVLLTQKPVADLGHVKGVRKVVVRHEVVVLANSVQKLLELGAVKLEFTDEVQGFKHVVAAIQQSLSIIL